MKKLTLFLSVLLAMAVFAFAASAAPVDYTANEDGSFDVTYTGTAGEYYALVIVEGIAAEGTAPVITSSSIQYIDQVTAAADGTAAFNGILLKTDGVKGTVYLGGSDLDAAKLLGYVNNSGTEETFTVSGTVTSDSAKEAKVTLTSTSDAAKVFTVDTASGSYTISVPADTYKFVVTKAAHLSYTKNALEVTADVAKNVELKGGDVDQNGTVAFADLTEVLNLYGNADENADVNGDGSIGFADLTAVLNNYGVTAVVE